MTEHICQGWHLSRQHCPVQGASKNSRSSPNVTVHRTANAGERKVRGSRSWNILRNILQQVHSCIMQEAPTRQLMQVGQSTIHMVTIRQEALASQSQCSLKTGNGEEAQTFGSISASAQQACRSCTQKKVKHHRLQSPRWVKNEVATSAANATDTDL